MRIREHMFDWEYRPDKKTKRFPFPQAPGGCLPRKSAMPAAVTTRFPCRSAAAVPRRKPLPAGSARLFPVDWCCCDMPTPTRTRWKQRNSPVSRFSPNWRTFPSRCNSRSRGFWVPPLPANFPIGNGLGVALVIQSTAAQDIQPGETAFLCLQDARLEFQPRQRDENVTV